jgi:hypothetical protein
MMRAAEADRDHVDKPSQAWAFQLFGHLFASRDNTFFHLPIRCIPQIHDPSISLRILFRPIGVDERVPRGIDGPIAIASL